MAMCVCFCVVGWCHILECIYIGRQRERERERGQEREGERAREKESEMEERKTNLGFRILAMAMCVLFCVVGRCDILKNVYI